MKLIKCMALAAMLCVQMQVVNAAQDNRVQCVNKSWYSYDVSLYVGTMVYANQPPVCVYSGETKELSIPFATMKSLIQQYPDTFEVKAVVSSWALGMKNKSLIFGSNPYNGGRAGYISKFNPEQYGLLLSINDATSTEIAYSVFPLQNK